MTNPADVCNQSSTAIPTPRPITEARIRALRTVRRTLGLSLDWLEGELGEQAPEVKALVEIRRRLGARIDALGGVR